MATASTPFSSRYSWIASTSAFFSANNSTCHMRVVHNILIFKKNLCLSFKPLAHISLLQSKYSPEVEFSANTPAGTPSWLPLWHIPLPVHRHKRRVRFITQTANLRLGRQWSVTDRDEHTWMTSKLAAPARPTLIVMGFTRALLAKFWIFLGIVALKSSVCLWPLMKKRSKQFW